MRYIRLTGLFAVVAAIVWTSRGAALTPAEWADTRVGTSVPGLGSCMPGPCVPHGSVYPSPDTLWPNPNSKGKRAPTSGYHHGDEVTGFSQFHTQGTGGHPSYGIILVSPTCGTSDEEADLASPIALLETRPYLFRARLGKDGIDVALAATRFGAVYEFTFPEGKAGRVVVNAKRKIGRPDGGTDVSVFRSGNAVYGGGTYDYNWCPGPYRCFFYAEEEKKGRTTVFRIATSFKSPEKAKANFAEVRRKSVAEVSSAAKAKWEDVLGRVRVEGLSAKDMRLFYSHLFHAFVQPRNRTGDIDVWPDGVEMWDDHYTLWDTWKTLFPLMAIVDPATLAGCVNSFSARSEKNGFVGVGFCAGREYRVGQAGDESDNIMADAFVKKIPGIDWSRAYAAMRRHAAKRTPGYLEHGYVPFGEKTEYCWRMKSGSSTLGFAYNDFCVAQVAAGLGHSKDAGFYLARSKNWTNIWDEAMTDAPSGYRGFCHGRHPDGRFTDVVAREGMQNPAGRKYFGDFYEGSCWEYSYMIPGDIPGMIERMGGREKFTARLLYAFENNLVDYGNEPSFITTWLFNFVGRPDCTSKWAHIFRSKFEEMEIPGDDDSGAMGSMYVFLTSGIFPIAGQNLYALHAPAARKISFTLPQSGKTFTVRSEIPADGSVFGSVYLNGTRLETPFIRHEQMLAGGELVFGPPENGTACVKNDLQMNRNDEWKSVPVDRVRLEGPLGRRIALTATNNLMKIDLEKTFFGPFRKKTAKGGFIGLGKLLDGAAYLAKYTGFPETTERKKEIARVLAETQDEDGYIGYFAPEARFRKLWDLHEIGFVLQGLVSDWELFGERRSLEAARKAADFVMRKWKDLPDGWEFEDITDRETTLGLGHGFIRLAAATGEMKYLDFAKNERALMDWDAPIVLGRGGMLYGQAYGFLGTALEQLELYGREASPKLLKPSFRALEHMTRNNGLLINGTGGIAECWTDDQDGEGCVGETCLIAFQFLFYDRMIRLGQGDTAQIGDLMERLALNALPAAQSRNGRRLRYYTPLNGERKYFETDAYCCPNNFRRAMGRLPGYVYYERNGGILANLFEASRAELDVGTAKVSVVCKTDYPASGKVTYVLDPGKPAQFAFMFRLPKWCKAPRVEVNGKRVTYPCGPGDMMSLPRVWKKGDTVSIDFPMEVRCVKGRKRQSGRFAVMRGPLLYALDTRRVKNFEKAHPLDAASVIMLDPAQLEFRPAADGGRAAFCGTAVATRANVRDWDRGVGPSDPEILLTEFADEDNTLTYFRTPWPESPLLTDDELFTDGCKR